MSLSISKRRPVCPAAPLTHVNVIFSVLWGGYPQRKGCDDLTSNPLALQLYTVRDQLPSGRRAVLQAIRGFGYGAVEPYDVQTDPGALRADLEETGLVVCSVHARALGDDAREQKALQRALRLRAVP